MSTNQRNTGTTGTEAEDTAPKKSEQRVKHRRKIGQKSTKIDEKSMTNRRKIGLGQFWAFKAVSGTRRDALGTILGRPKVAPRPILGRPGRAKSSQEPSKTVPRAHPRRSKSFWGHAQDARKRRWHRPTQLEAFADRFLNVFGRRAAAPKCISYRPCQCFIDVERFVRRILAAHKTPRKKNRFRLQNRGPGRSGEPTWIKKLPQTSQEAPQSPLIKKAPKTQTLQLIWWSLAFYFFFLLFFSLFSFFVLFFLFFFFFFSLFL